MSATGEPSPACAAATCSGSAISPPRRSPSSSTPPSDAEVGERAIKKVPALRGKTIVNLFFEPSTRTRTSFEFAEKRLSADTVNVAVPTLERSKGETLVDTARNLEAMALDMVVIRHGRLGRGHQLATALPVAHHQRRRRHARAPDAGDCSTPHDARGTRGASRGCRSPSSATSCTAASLRSNLRLLRKLGAKVGVCGPATLLPSGIEELGATVLPHDRGRDRGRRRA